MSLIEFCPFHDDPNCSNSFGDHILVSFVFFESFDVAADDGCEIFDGDGHLVVVERLDGG